MKQTRWNEEAIMDESTERRPMFRNLGIGLLMGIALAIGFQFMFDDAWIGIVLGLVIGVVLFGGLSTART
jgi:uncharacterized membrane protein